MKYESYPALTQPILEAYGGRKQKDFICVFVNVKTNEVIPVPINQEHINFAANILSVRRKDIISNPFLCSHLIPSIIQITNKKIVAVVTGASGLEVGFKVKHKLEDLQKAHTLVWNFINLGDIEVGKIIENRIVERFAIKQ